MRVIVVDKNDQILGYKDRDDRNTEDIIRVAGLWVYNSNNEVLIAQRSVNKIHDPGKWGPSAAGTVEEGETYASNIIKEAEEELGIVVKEDQLIPGPHIYQETSHKYFAQYFSAKIDLPIQEFTIQKEEVENIHWVPIKELSDWIESKPQDFLASFPGSFKNWRDSYCKE